MYIRTTRYPTCSLALEVAVKVRSILTALRDPIGDKRMVLVQAAGSAAPLS